MICWFCHIIILYQRIVGTTVAVRDHLNTATDALLHEEMQIDVGLVDRVRDQVDRDTCHLQRSFEGQSRSGVEMNRIERVVTQTHVPKRFENGGEK